jgi:hypothetical protein
MRSAAFQPGRTQWINKTLAIVQYYRRCSGCFPWLARSMAQNVVGEKEFSVGW